MVPEEIKLDNILLIVRLTKQRYEKDIKYNGIINAFRNMGYCVWYPYIDGKNIFIGNGSETFKIGKKTEKFDIITKNTSFVSAIRNFIRDTEIQFKYCYIRSMPSIGAYRKMLVEIKKKNIKMSCP